VGQVERGETNVTVSTLALFAGRLNTTISAIFRGIA
jgi:transcriptional regulator with XRE-family HTH domain